MAGATAASPTGTAPGPSPYGDTRMNDYVDLGQDATEWLEETTGLPVSNMIRMIGGAVVLIAIIVVVVNAVLTTDAVANSSGPFASVITNLETTGVAAMGLLIIGLLVAAGMWIMRIMDMGGGGGF